MNVFLPLWIFGCSADLTPTWAFDPVWIEPAPNERVHGFQTWQIYGPKWPKRYDERHYVCSVVAEIAGDPIACDAEPGCTFAWAVEAEVLETDCPDPSLADDELFTLLDRVALGLPSTAPDAAWPGLTTVGWADYGEGWEIHGDAYPEALDLGATLSDGEWDGLQPFLMVPSKSFPAP